MKVYLMLEVGLDQNQEKNRNLLSLNQDLKSYKEMARLFYLKQEIRKKILENLKHKLKQELEKNNMVKNIIRQYVRKRTAKKDKEGIMITLPDSEQVDFKVSLIMEILMRNGVDPNTIKTDEMLENVMAAIEKKESMEQAREQGIMSSQQADIFNLSGEKLDPSKPISGGTQEGKKIKSDFFFRQANRPEKQMQRLKQD